jgi:ABC-type cobalamin/Fe3+-siderophores transport system ATPase subunit
MPVELFERRRWGCDQVIGIVGPGGAGKTTLGLRNAQG